ncbi:MAG TPA: HAMP domain-containing sensor histidine kinase [Verrucomicrobiae bacterium]|nr:HAMP domain-containing sensor histidine kinase [Verrucomicrobiae bacterium]
MSLRRLYTRFVAPRSKTAEAQSREITLNILLLGTLLLAFGAVSILVVNLFTIDRSFTQVRLWLCLGVTVFIYSLYLLSRHGHYRIASNLFVSLYFLIFVSMILSWSIQIPQGILMAAFVIILSGILLGSPYALYAALLNILVLLGGLYLTDPNIRWKQSPPSAGDVVVFGATFGLIATVCWLFNGRIERSLERAERSEAALRRQKDLLEIKVERRTKKLQAVQLEQIQQVYRFAELGLVSTALLHDLANHLSTISLDIEGLEGESNSQILGRIKRTIRYIDNSVQKTRQQLHGQASVQRFAVHTSLDEVMEILSYRAQQQDVDLVVEGKRLETIHLHGDEMRFKQMLTNIIGNGIDASGDAPVGQRKTIVTVETSQKRLLVQVTDFGKGLPASKKNHLFEPFYSTKKSGMGLGLFMAKEIAERGFGGGISANSSRADGTTFTVDLPLKKT